MMEDIFKKETWPRWYGCRLNKGMGCLVSVPTMKSVFDGQKYIQAEKGILDFLINYLLYVSLNLWKLHIFYHPFF